MKEFHSQTKSIHTRELLCSILIVILLSITNFQLLTSGHCHQPGLLCMSKYQFVSNQPIYNTIHINCSEMRCKFTQK